MNSFDQAIQEIADSIVQLVISKQRDYGKGNILKCPVGPELGILVRESDKLNRIGNLLQSADIPSNESLEDSWKDVAGYALIALMVRQNTFTLPLDAPNKL